MKNNFVTLRRFACESLSRSLKPNVSDFEMQMSFGPKYAKHISNNLNNRFNVIDFTTNDNNIVKSMHCVTDRGHVDLFLSKNVLTNESQLRVVINEDEQITTISESYSLFPEFVQKVEELFKAQTIE